MIGATYLSKVSNLMAVLESIGNMGSVYYMRYDSDKLLGVSMVEFLERWSKQ